MLVSGDKANLYSKVTNKTISSTRDFMAQTYGTQKTQYYAPIQEEENKIKKRSKAKIIGIITASALVALGITIPLLGRKKLDVKYFEQLSKEAGEKIQELQLKDKISNAMSNFTNVKDDLWDKFANSLKEIKLFNKFYPFKFISKGGEKLTNLYHTIAQKPYQSEWDKLFGQVTKYAKATGIDGLEEEVQELNFQKFYSSIKDAINVALHQKGNRVSDNLFNKDVFSKVTLGNIADVKISKIAKSVFKDFSSNIDLDKMYDEAISSNQVEKAVNIRSLQKALSDLNSYKNESFRKLFPKMRDICTGSAPTDVLTQLFALGSLGVVVANSDTKEEKQDAVINLGIPIITALSTTTIALIRSTSGAAALAFGLIFGEIASYTAKGISYLHTKHNKKVYEKIKAQVLEEQKNAL